jgi:hypothetical protein
MRRVPTGVPHTVELMVDPRPHTAGDQLMVLARTDVQLHLTEAGLLVMAVDPTAGLHLPTGEEPRHMAEAEQHRLTEVVGATVADLAVGTRLPAVVAVATAAAVEVGTVAEGTTKLRSHRIFQQRRRRAALLLWVR